MLFRSNFVFTATRTLPAPVFADLDWRDADILDHAQRARIGVAVRTLWPQPQLAQLAAASTLPVPAAGVFRVPEALDLTLLATRSTASRRLAAPAAGAPRAQAISARQVKHPKQAAHQVPAAADGRGRGAPLQVAPPTASNASVHVAKRVPRAEASAASKRVPD